MATSSGKYVPDDPVQTAAATESDIDQTYLCRRWQRAVLSTLCVIVKVERFIGVSSDIGSNDVLRV